MATRGGGVYFPVDAGFCDTQAARQVTRRYGAEGFLAYVRLLCMLLREDGGRLSVGLEEDWEDIADQVGLDCDATRGVVSCLAHYGALVVEDGTLFSPLVSSGIAAREDISEKRRAAAQARWERMNAARKEKKGG